MRGCAHCRRNRVAAALVEKFRPNILRRVGHGANDDPVGVVAVEDEMRLKAEAPITGHKAIGALPDTGKIGQKAECPLQARKIGIGLIAPETSFDGIVNRDKLGLGPIR
jgi:hypothetical protein